MLGAGQLAVTPSLLQACMEGGLVELLAQGAFAVPRGGAAPSVQLAHGANSKTAS